MPSLSANKQLTVPTNGGDSGVWGTGNNATINEVDGMLGGVLSLGLTNVNVTLTDPGAPAPGAGPTQAQNALLRFTGTLTGNVTVTNRLPGCYTVENRCTGAFNVTLSNGGGGEKVAVPPFEMVDVFSDGTNIRFRNLGRVGSYLFLAGSTVPAWISACDVPPFLLCDGSNYVTATYPALSAIVLPSFGNPGGGQFTVPDLRGRVPVMLNLGTGRTTNALTGGLDGNTLGAVGGERGHTVLTAEMPSHAHGITEPNSGQGHQHNIPGVVLSGGTTFLGGGGVFLLTSENSGFSTTGITINSTGSDGAHNNIQPAQTAGIWLIKT